MWDPASYKPALWKPLLSLLLKGSSPTGLLLLLSPASSPHASYEGTWPFYGGGQSQWRLRQKLQEPSGLLGPLTPMPLLLDTFSLHVLQSSRAHPWLAHLHCAIKSGHFSSSTGLGTVSQTLTASTAIIRKWMFPEPLSSNCPMAVS